MPFVNRKPEAPAVAPEEQKAKPAEQPAAAPVKKEKYYRVRKISGYLSELLEVEVDETENTPVRVGKEDTLELIIGKAADFLYVHPDDRRKRQKR